MKKSKKIKNQLLIILAFFTLTAVAIGFISLHYFRKVHEVYEVSSGVHRLYDRYSRTVTAEQKFIFLETSKSSFFETGNSRFLNDFNLYLADAKSEIKVLKNRKAYTDFEIDDQIGLLGETLNKYETLFDFTVSKIKAKGFKDFGSEGTMRSYVHELENHSHQIGLANILMLRRHEKDYMLRNDTVYVKKLLSKVASIKQKIWRNQQLQNAEKDTLLNLIQNYQYSFLELVKYTQEIGHKNELGMSELLAQCNFVIDKQFKEITDAILLKEEALVTHIEGILMIVIFNIILISIFTIYIYSRKIPVVSFIQPKLETELSLKKSQYPVAETV